MTATRFPRQRGRTGAWSSTSIAIVAAATFAVHAAPSAALALDVIRLDGIVGATSVPGSIGDLTLAIGDRSIPYSVLRAQKVTGTPATGPEIFSALGPGPPPLRVAGRDAAVAKITGAEPGTRLTITGDLDPASSFLTLMDVEPVPTPSAAQ